MPSWSDGCSGLPDWPSVLQLRAAGFGDGVPWVSATLGFLLGACSCIPSICQAVNFIKSHSVQGVSLVTIVLFAWTSIMQFTVAAAAAGPALWLCPTLGVSGCFAASLSLWQFSLQLPGPIVLFCLYMYVWKREGKVVGEDVRFEAAGAQLTRNAEVACQDAPHASTRSSKCAMFLGWLSFGLALAVLVFFAFIPYIVGPCAAFVGFVCDLAGALGTISTICYLLPQMVLLCRMRDRGTLSIGMLLVQVVGNTIQVINFMIEGAPIAALLPFAFQGLECGIVLIMVAVLECK